MITREEIEARVRTVFPKIARPRIIDRSLLHDRPFADCWPWAGAIESDGYGRAAYPGASAKATTAQRAVWETIYGAVPDGYHIDHLCHDPNTCRLTELCPHRACVNPTHLAAVPAAVNVLRSNGVTAANAQKTHCSRGHAFTTDNTSPNGYGRRCRSCEVQRLRDRRANEGKPPRYKRRTFEISTPTGGIEK